MTTPTIAPAPAGVEVEDDTTHIRCMVCKHEPVTSVCGTEMTEGDERPQGSTVNCSRCAELWPMHVDVLHPVSRARQRTRRRL